MISLIGQTPLEGTERFPSAQEACPCEWVQVSWDEPALLCRRRAWQLQGEEQPAAIVALARAVASHAHILQPWISDCA